MPLQQLHPSSSLSFRTYSRKDGIRIPNGKHFPELVTGPKDLNFQRVNYLGSKPYIENSKFR